MIRLYNVLSEFRYLSNPEEPKITPEVENTSEEPELATPVAEVIETDVDPNLGLNKALDTYRKLIEKNVDNALEPLTEKEQAKLESRITEIQERKIIEKIEDHEIVEIPCEKGQITIGPPTLTRFEKARIMGARALQLSLGAPPFIEIPKSARISLDISMEELEKRVIPITIRRVLPNGDYQNIPIDYFE
ncbi:MAG: DNA-directed RNA polymerase subunit K [Candidatus Nitrosopumilus sp. metabat.KBP569_Feb_25m_nospike.7]|nr:DNA-directed RNA polymerase subunit K [Nitrosopumilus sp.]